ncbi:NUMOD3 domain-containing DNA-binding protein [Citrobacter freundii]|uniref:NUMOD3 domain-containing DNA-binding protein n=1 Tax=Citrobacter freundii TaxID=546 RepID=UPI0032991BAC
MNHICYCTVIKTVQSSNIRYYVGKHSTININDGYIGSGHRIRRIIKKESLNPNTYEIEIYKTKNLESEELAYEFEELAISEARDKFGDKVLNIANGGRGVMQGLKHSDASKKKIGMAWKGKHRDPKSVAIGAKKRSGENHFLYGIKLSDEYKIKLSNAAKDKLKGFKHSEESKRNMSIGSRSELWSSYKELYNIWINNECPTYRKFREIIISKGYPNKATQTIVKHFKTYGENL